MPDVGASARSLRQRFGAWLGTLTALMVIAAGMVACSRGTGTRFQLEPVGASSVPAFTPAVGEGQASSAPADTGGSVAANTPGLYGGTRNNASCDPAAMVRFLQAHPDRAAAWASVLGIRQSDIATYVASLTSVVLRSDTVVNNHGFDNGRVTTMTSVLQAGTAVLVDKFGTPVTRCFCGNPLTKAPAPEKPAFTGTPWPGFSSTNVTVIVQSTVVVTQFTIVDIHTGTAFGRPPGTDGGHDEAAAQAPAWPPSAGPSGSATAAPSGSSGAPTSAAGASWIMDNCLVDRTSGLALRGTISVKNEDPPHSHTYTVRYLFGQQGSPYAEGVTTLDAGPGTVASTQVVETTVSAQANSLPAGPLPCEITQIRDENGQTPVQQGSLTPSPTGGSTQTESPPSTQPSATTGVPPAQPSPS